MNFEQASSSIRSVFAEYCGAKKSPFVPGQSIVQYAGNFFGAEELSSAADTLLKGWLGLAEQGAEFEAKLASALDKPYGLLTNSGSSAVLLAVAALKSKRFSRRLFAGDEIVTPASAFPTTVNPIIQNGFVPVFVDVEIGSYNPGPEAILSALSPRTRAVVLAHTLGNPAAIAEIVDLCEKKGLVLIEDCCDALGSTYDGKPVGSFGDFATVSLYPSHHITIGEGGFVAVRNPDDLNIIRSLRDWGRACWCSGQSSLLEMGSCKNRFAKWLPGIDEPIDHKYVYDEIGYNLKPIELQAAIGLEQIKRLPSFIEARKRNFKRYYDFFCAWKEFFHLPSWDNRSVPSWFAFPLTVRLDAPFRRADIVRHLEALRIQTRNLFSGNILRHPGYCDIKHRVSGTLVNSDLVVTNTFFIGVYPGITEEMTSYVVSSAEEFLRKYR
jgi:CDP-4-dehydro-6-deoxyglucose reductase, E1